MIETTVGGGTQTTRSTPPPPENFPPMPIRGGGVDEKAIHEREAARRVVSPDPSENPNAAYTEGMADHE